MFDAIVVPTHRPAKRLRASIDLARRTRRPLIVMCSRAVRQADVIRRANEAGIEAFAFNMPAWQPAGDRLRHLAGRELSAASPDRNSDLSMKRNIGLVLGRLLRWNRLMFLDDDIYWVGQRQVTALAAALENHKVSALIPKRGFPDNSVVCHAHRLGGGTQDVFASASSIGVRCDRPDLAFFPKVYNEDWFFFADEAASHRIKPVGESYQRKYDPYDTPGRAAWEEFGDLLAEGLYARLDIREGIWDVDASYWGYFIERRARFHQRVAESLTRVKRERRVEAAKAAESIRAAQDQLEKITPELCMKFMRGWQADLEEWRSYLVGLPHLTTVEEAFDYLKITPADWGKSVIVGLAASIRYVIPKSFLSAARSARLYCSSSSSTSSLSNVRMNWASGSFDFRPVRLKSMRS